MMDMVAVHGATTVEAAQAFNVSDNTVKRALRVNGREYQRRNGPGEMHALAQLTADMVRTLRRRAATGEPTWKIYLDYPQFTDDIMRNAISGRSWACITDVPPVSLHFQTPQAVLTADDVTQARRSVRSGIETVEDVAERLGLRYNTVWGAVTGKSWNHLEEPPVKGVRKFRITKSIAGNPGAN
jgi:hypothetical protein